MLDELTTLGEGAHLADLHPMDELCEALLDLYGAVEESSLVVSERFFHEAQSAHGFDQHVDGGRPGSQSPTGPRAGPALICSMKAWIRPRWA